MSARICDICKKEKDQMYEWYHKVVSRVEHTIIKSLDVNLVIMKVGKVMQKPLVEKQIRHEVRRNI